MDRLDQLVAAVRKIAAERPDIKYNHSNCFYDDLKCTDGSVGCLLGQGLAAIGWILYDEGYRHEISISDLLVQAGYREADTRIRWCSRVQTRQDICSAWGKCIEYADEEIKI